MNGFTDIWYKSYLFSFSQIRQEMSFRGYKGTMCEFMHWFFDNPRYTITFKPGKGYLVEIDDRL